MPSNSKPEESETPKKSGGADDDEISAKGQEGASGGEVKAEALSLFEQQERREAGKGKRRTVEASSAEGSGILPPFSKLMEGDEPADEPDAPKADDAEADSLTVIHIKPPIIL